MKKLKYWIWKKLQRGQPGKSTKDDIAFGISGTKLLYHMITSQDIRFLRSFSRRDPRYLSQFYFLFRKELTATGKGTIVLHVDHGRVNSSPVNADRFIKLALGNKMSFSVTGTGTVGTVVGTAPWDLSA
jgi:hypothetical protein